MERKKYYVNPGSLEISQVRYDNNDIFAIYATESEVAQLRSIMNDMDSAELRTYWRAHVPFRPYHKDESNDDYDSGIVQAFQMIYDLGDDETKRHIETMEILDGRGM